MHDIIFCSLPYSNLDQIYSAPAILKGVAVSNGFKSKTVDFGCMLLNQLNRDVDKFNSAQTYFISSGNALTHKEDINRFYQNCLNFLQDNPSTYIGISVLSIFTHRAVYELCALIKEAKINSKIVIGGRGAKTTTFSNVAGQLGLSAKEKLLQFGDVLKNRGIVDHVIVGDGENAVLDLLTNGQANSDAVADDEFRSPVPDYHDYNFNDYLFSGEIMLPVTGSKGCVRDCDFCDVKFQFGKYRYRSGKDIANELIDISTKFGIRKFQFTDSLVNGGLKPFREFLEIMSSYNLQNPDKRITWNGQYICRSYQAPQDDLYKLMRDSGAHGLTIGAESGSNRVLEAMNKKTTVEALLLELENFRKYNITCVLLTFVGHWSETWEDFAEHCQMFVKIAPYVRSGTISAVSLGLPFILLDGTPSMFEHEINNIKIDLSNRAQGNNWVNENNPDNTFKERLYRRLILHNLCKKLNIPTVSDNEHILYLINVVKSLQKDLNEFQQTIGRTSVLS